MASLCELDKVSKQDILTLQLIQGVYDKELKMTLLNKINDDLDSLVELAHAWSNAKEFWLNEETFSSSIETDKNENLTKKYTTQKNMLPQGKPQHRRQNNDKKPYREATHPRRNRTRETSSHTQRAIPYTTYVCTGCGGRHNTSDPSDICPATTQTCFVCNEEGHYARCCTYTQCATHHSKFLRKYGIHPQPTEPRRRDITKAIAADESPMMKDGADNPTTTMGQAPGMVASSSTEETFDHKDTEQATLCEAITHERAADARSIDPIEESKPRTVTTEPSAAKATAKHTQKPEDNGTTCCIMKATAWAI